MCTYEEKRNANAERQRRLRARRKVAHRQYQSERRAAIVGCAIGGQRLRVVGVDCLPGTAAYKRSQAVAHV